MTPYVESTENKSFTQESEKIHGYPVVELIHVEIKFLISENCIQNIKLYDRNVSYYIGTILSLVQT